MSDERLSFVRKADAIEKSFSLPYANTNVLLLGPGTSVTHQAARLLGDEGVMLGFVGGGGTPLYLASQSEYRPTEHLQRWASFWFDERKRLQVAKQFQNVRAQNIQRSYRELGVAGVDEALAAYSEAVSAASDNTALLLAEAHFSKRLYGILARLHGVANFSRKPQAGDALNNFLDAGNYMAYGFAAAALWILGVPHSFGINHGMTRRGALVFDVADIVKDACVMPHAFIGAHERDNESKNRQRVLVALENASALKQMLDVIAKAPDWAEETME